MSTQAILNEIRAGARQLGIAPSTLCLRALNNTKLVRRLERGGTLTVDTLDRLRKYLKTEGKKRGMK